MALGVDFTKFPRCGAKAKSNFHNPCGQVAMKNGRCHWHGGARKTKTALHTNRSQKKRNEQRQLIDELRDSMSSLINTLKEK